MSTLDLSLPMLQLAFEATPLAVVQIKPSETIPSALLEAITENSEFLSITRTKFETSVVLPWDECERAFAQVKEGKETSGPWIALKIRGPMEFSLSGILHELTRPLKAAEVPIFAISTWDTDYVLIDAKNEAAARRALTEAGWQFAATS
ncbi:hypothetical protein RHOSPDRAFT_31027 [Rhodotorula sp. JG-1b]|nr:hypothetical protein RHOSPDRAFT_31027 [Rhodotorula sp. JG-1b]